MSLHARAMMNYEKIQELVTLIQIVEHDKQRGYITEETAKEKLNQYRDMFDRIHAETARLTKEIDTK